MYLESDWFMGIFKKLSNLFSVSGDSDSYAYWLNVQCNRCGEHIRARVDLRNDLSPIYSEKGTTYFCRKVLVGEQRCFQKIEVEIDFDQDRKVVDRRIQGGKFVSGESV
jgi:hypothetical protein